MSKTVDKEKGKKSVSKPVDKEKDKPRRITMKRPAKMAVGQCDASNSSEEMYKSKSASECSDDEMMSGDTDTK